jgi:hypothetical protein
MLNRLEEDHSALGDLAEEHRQAEEQVVLAAFVEQGGDPNDPRIVQMLTEHLRLRAGDGSLIEAHERFEEEVVFPFIRSVLPADRPRRAWSPCRTSSCSRPRIQRPAARRAQGVHAVVAPLVDVHGITLVVTSVELWVDVVIVRIGGLPSEESDPPDRRGRGRPREWTHTSGAEPPTPWDDFRGLEIAVRDDAGTRYRKPRRRRRRDRNRVGDGVALRPGSARGGRDALRHRGPRRRAGGVRGSDPALAVLAER